MSDVNSSPPQRKPLLDPEEVLRLNGIAILRRSRYYTTCPQCSSKRQKAHQQLKCLGVTRPDHERVYWGCNHCGWSGPGKHEASYHPTQKRPSYQRKDIVGRHATIKTIYSYSPLLRKVKIMTSGGKKMWWEFKHKGWWAYGTGGIETDVLMYRIGTAKKMALALRLPICLAEGEKDVDCLMNLGIPASCNAHGASEPDVAPKWSACHSDQISGFDVVVFNDDDAAGIAHREACCRL